MAVILPVAAFAWSGGGLIQRRLPRAALHDRRHRRHRIRRGERAAAVGASVLAGQRRQWESARGQAQHSPN